MLKPAPAAGFKWFSVVFGILPKCSCQTQNLPGFTPRGGSSPFSGTSFQSAQLSFVHYRPPACLGYRRVVARLSPLPLRVLSALLLNDGPVGVRGREMRIAHGCLNGFVTHQNLNCAF